MEPAGRPAVSWWSCALLSFNLLATLLAWGGQWWVVIKELSLAKASALFGEDVVGVLGGSHPYWRLLVSVNLFGVAVTSCIGVRRYLYPAEGGRRDLCKAMVTAMDLDTPYFIFTQGMPYILGQEEKAVDILPMRQRNAYFRGLPTAMVGMFVVLRGILAWKLDTICLRMIMRFDMEYGAQAENEFGRPLMPPLSQISHARVPEKISQFFRNIGNLERPRVVNGVRTEAEWFDRTFDWGCVTEDITAFDGLAAFVVEARRDIVTYSVWETLDDRPLMKGALQLAGISSPSSLDRRLTEASRECGIAEFKKGNRRPGAGRGFKGYSGEVGLVFFLDFDQRFLWLTLLQALFQFVTASKAIAEQASNFGSVPRLQKYALYLHVVLDGAISIGALLISFVFVPGMCGWIEFLEQLTSISKEALASGQLDALVTGKASNEAEVLGQVLPLISQAMVKFESPLKDLHTPSRSEGSRVMGMLVFLGLLHGLTALLLGTSAYDLQAVITSPVASLGKDDRSFRISLLALAGKAAALIAICIGGAAWNFKMFQTIVALLLNLRVALVAYALMLFAVLVLLLGSGYVAAAALEAAREDGADPSERAVSGYELAQFPSPQCACACTEGRKKKQRRNKHQGVEEPVFRQPMSEQLLGNYGSCAPGAAELRGHAAVLTTQLGYPVSQRDQQ